MDNAETPEVPQLNIEDVEAQESTGNTDEIPKVPPLEIKDLEDDGKSLESGSGNKPQNGIGLLTIFTTLYL